MKQRMEAKMAEAWLPCGIRSRSITGRWRWDGGSSSTSSQCVANLHSIAVSMLWTNYHSNFIIIFKCSSFWTTISVAIDLSKRRSICDSISSMATLDRWMYKVRIEGRASPTFYVIYCISNNVFFNLVVVNSTFKITQTLRKSTFLLITLVHVVTSPLTVSSHATMYVPTRQLLYCIYSKLRTVQ